MSGSITVGGKILASHDNVSGKLSMSGDVVFPAGHVIQVKTQKYTTLEQAISTSTTGTPTGLYVDIIPKYAGSKMLVNCAFTAGKDGTNNIVNYYIYRSTGSTASSANTTGSYPGSSGYYFNTASSAVYISLALLWEDTAENTSLHTYNLYVVSGSSMTTYLNSRGDTGYTGTSTISVMEIKQ
jgi:hypothetical protein